MKQTPQPWERLSRRLLQKTVVFDLLVDRLRSPRNGREDDFYIIDVVDWVNIIPITHEGEVILVQQYRFGVECLSLELPGGMLSRREEDPAEAALREMEEETGYTAERVIPLGWCHPNPAIQTNRCHFFVAPEVRPRGQFNQDELEDISVERRALREIPNLLEQEGISHALMVTAFMRLFTRYGAEVFERPSELLAL